MHTMLGPVRQCGMALSSKRPCSHDFSQPQMHGKLFSLPQLQSHFLHPASGGLALLQVCRYTHNLCSYPLTQQSGNSVACTITLILTTTIILANQSDQNITVEYAPPQALERQILTFCSDSYPCLIHLRISLTMAMMLHITLHLKGLPPAL